MNLREYRPADFDRLCEIDRRCFKARVAYTPGEMAAFLAKTGAMALVAEDRRVRVVAFVLAEKGRQGRGHVITLDVLPGYRGRGVGRELLRRCEECLQSAGVRVVRLETAVKNRAAQRLYQSAGYVRVGRAPRYYPDGEDAWVMEKRLEADRVRA